MIKVAVIGYGGAFDMGKQHLLQARKAGMTPTAVVETDASRLEERRSLGSDTGRRARGAEVALEDLLVAQAILQS